MYDTSQITPDATPLDFQRDVLDASHKQPILVDFWAPWCGPCRVLGPVLERLEDAAGGAWRLVKLNTEEYQDLALDYKVASIPAVKLFHKGEVIAEFVGALPEPQIERWLEAYIPTPAKEDLATAQQAITAGDTAKARALLEKLAEETANHAARALLATLILRDDRVRARELVSQVGIGDIEHETAESVRTLCHLQDLATSGDAELSGQRGAEQYLVGCRAFAAASYGEAAEAFIEVLRTNRKLDDDGARKACVALFRWLGDEHAVTREYRRSFSSALF